MIRVKKMSSVSQGAFAAAYEQFRYKKIDTCLEDTRSSDLEGQLSALDMAGVCLLFNVFLLVAVGLRLGKRGVRRIKSRLSVRSEISEIRKESAEVGGRVETLETVETQAEMRNDLNDLEADYTKQKVTQI